jgi:hypothetical protein
MRLKKEHVAENTPSPCGLPFDAFPLASGSTPTIQRDALAKRRDEVAVLVEGKKREIIEGDAVAALAAAQQVPVLETILSAIDDALPLLDERIRADAESARLARAMRPNRADLIIDQVRDLEHRYSAGEISCGDLIEQRRALQLQA